MENINPKQTEQTPEFRQFIEELDKEKGDVSAEEVKKAEEAFEAEEITEQLDQEIKAKPVERRMGEKSDYYRQFYKRIFNVSPEQRQEELNKLETELNEEAQKKLTPELKIKISSYNALAKNFPNFDFGKKEQEVISKPWKTHEVSDEMIMEPEDEKPPELTREKEVELLKEVKRKETREKIEEEMKKPKIELAPEYQAEIQEIAKEEKEEIVKLQKQIAEASKDEEIKEVISGFEPEKFVKTRQNFFDIQNDLMDAYNFVPGGGFRNTLRVLFKKPKVFGDFLKLKKKYNNLNEYISKQGDIAYSYLETTEKSKLPEKGEKKIQDVDVINRLEMEATKVPDILKKYETNIFELEKQIKESKKNEEIAEVIDFSAKEYFEDYVNMLSLQDELMENFGFIVGKSGTRNLWEAAKRGDLKTYSYLKKTYDNFIDRLSKKEKGLAYLGTDKLAKAKLDTKKIRKYKQPELWERLKRALGE